MDTRALQKALKSSAAMDTSDEKKSDAPFSYIPDEFWDEEFGYEFNVEKLIKNHNDQTKPLDIQNCYISEDQIATICERIVENTAIKAVYLPLYFVNMLNAIKDKSEHARKILSMHQKSPRDKVFESIISREKNLKLLAEKLAELDIDTMETFIFFISSYAQSENYFPFCVNVLLVTACQVDERAKEHLTNLFICGYYCNIALKDKMRHMKKICFDVIKNQDDDWAAEKSGVLVDVLSAAANPYETGEAGFMPIDYDGETYHAYVRTALDLLFEFTQVIKDEHLAYCSTDASRALESLFNDTAWCTFAGEMPDRIMSYSIPSASETLKDFKEMLTEREIGKSLSFVFTNYPFHVLYVADNFSLSRSAYNANKGLNINDGPVLNGYTLHERQALAERLIFNRTTNIDKIDRGYPKLTYS
jgi:hypothetical protein